MIMKVSDLKPNMMVIYKINYPDGKSYIGYSIDLKRRMWEHNNRRDLSRPIPKCDQAIDKFGPIEEIEILEFINDIKMLDERETYWIKYYDTYNDKTKGYNETPGGGCIGLPGELSSRAKLTNAEVLDIRKRRFYGERKKDVYQDYKEKLSFGGFEKIWLGIGYSQVGKEYQIETNSISRQQYSHQANDGLKNGRAKVTLEQIHDMRNRYDAGEKFSEIHKLYPQFSQNTVTRICKRQTFKNVI